MGNTSQRKKIRRRLEVVLKDDNYFLNEHCRHDQETVVNPAPEIGISCEAMPKLEPWKSKLCVVQYTSMLLRSILTKFVNQER